MMAEDEGGITSQVNQETCYDMSGRRMALVLCMKEGRPGAHCDLTTLRSLLTNYKFDLTEMIDPTSKDVIPKIMEFRDEINQRRWEVSCCMVVIMAHGQYGRIKAADGGSVKLEDIFNVFDNHQCPELRQKPRAFVVQACRGDVFSFNPNVTDAANIQDEGPPTLKIPSFCDTLCVYATPPGREARRSPSSGCPVIEEMGRVFEESADRDDLFELFTKRRPWSGASGRSRAGSFCSWGPPSRRRRRGGDGLQRPVFAEKPLRGEKSDGWSSTVAAGGGHRWRGVPVLLTACGLHKG
ncbi:caspase-14-like isoform X2 [Amia ocellicauda]|uniref:caspase-14-like isoform X2 n=1 Tax=Amia ocellicauda TaxID=2972642 RepID=UPI003464540D